MSPSRLDPLLRPLDALLRSESAGGIVLMASAMIALLWANSPWGDSYSSLWHSTLSVTVNGHKGSMSLEQCVNDGLMVIFFLLVGLEIKRELLVGELATFRRALLPVAAAVGGMVVPAFIYIGVNRTGPGSAGWGIPMATDIAFAVGVLALVGRAVPTSVKVFLLAIAIVDDLGAVLVIAVFYTSNLSIIALAVAAAFFVALILLNVLRVHQPLPYVLLGVGLWVATLLSGIHATIAGVLLALTIPASRQIEELPYIDYVRRMLDLFERESKIVPDKITEDQSHALKAMEEASQAVQAPLARVEHALLRPVNLVIVPIFALANAGVDVRGGASAALHDPIAWGVLLGLLLGKPVGVLLATWLTLKTGIASPPEGSQTRQLIGVSVLCGIGFTMSLFVANLAFPNQQEKLAAAKLGILVASLAAGVVGSIILAGAGGYRAGTRISGAAASSSN